LTSAASIVVLASIVTGVSLIPLFMAGIWIFGYWEHPLFSPHCLRVNLAIRGIAISLGIVVTTVLGMRGRIPTTRFVRRRPLLVLAGVLLAVTGATVWDYLRCDLALLWPELTTWRLDACERELAHARQLAANREAPMGAVELRLEGLEFTRRGWRVRLFTGGTNPPDPNRAWYWLDACVLPLPESLRGKLDEEEDGFVYVHAVATPLSPGAYLVAALDIPPKREFSPWRRISMPVVPSESPSAHNR
jgi:hypothetical protein